MSEYIISCCSTADLTKEHLDKRNIPYACFHFELAGQSYTDDLGQSMSLAEFYKKMEEGADTKTSQVNVEEYLEFFEHFLRDGKDILHISLSSGISGTYNSACIAARELQDKYPDRKIYIVDSLNASAGYGLLMDKAADLRDSGMSVDELHTWLEENKCKLHAWFFTSDLTYLIRGGRVSKAAGAIGTVLNICPLLNIDPEGKLANRAKVRTKKKVIGEIVSRMKQHAQGSDAYQDKCYISHSACIEDAKTVAKLVEETFPNLTEKVLIGDIGTTIGSHTGPGTVALFFWGDKRVM